MWNSLGALRDRVRDNAKVVRENARAAAQVAQGVLIAAAQEDDDPAHPTDPTADPAADNQQRQQWGEWDQKQESDGDAGGLFAPTPADAALPPPPPPPTGETHADIPPPPSDAPPLPPPQDDAPEFSQSLPVRASRTRAKRYVEAGLKQPQVSAPGPPRPTMSLFQPSPPGASQENVKTSPEDITVAPQPFLTSPEHEGEKEQEDFLGWGGGWGAPKEEAKAIPESDCIGGVQAASQPESALYEEPAFNPEQIAFSSAENDTGFPSKHESNEGAVDLQMKEQNEEHVEKRLEQSDDLPRMNTEQEVEDMVPNASVDAPPTNESTALEFPGQTTESDMRSGADCNSQTKVDASGSKSVGVTTRDDDHDNNDGWAVTTSHGEHINDDTWDVATPERTQEDPDPWGVLDQDANAENSDPWNVQTQTGVAAGTGGLNAALLEEEKGEVETSNPFLQKNLGASLPSTDGTERHAEKGEIHTRDFQHEATIGFEAAPLQEPKGSSDGPFHGDFSPADGAEQSENSRRQSEPIEKQSEQTYPSRAFGMAQTVGNAHDIVIENERNESHAIPNNSTVEVDGWIQTDLEPNIATEPATDWFLAQSVQPETRDLTQSEVSALEDSFGSKGDSNLHRDEQVSLPTTQPLNFRTEDRDFVDWQKNIESCAANSATREVDVTSPSSAFQTKDSETELQQSWKSQSIDPDRESPPSHATCPVEQDKEGAPDARMDRLSDAAADVISAEALPSDMDAPMPALHRYDENAAIIANLRDVITKLRTEKEEAEKSRGANDKSIANLEKSVLELRDVLAKKSQNSDVLKAERDELRCQRDGLMREKAEVERERDAAVQHGGEGLREARGVIEAMRSTQDIAERREAVISEQIQALRGDLDCISEERNGLLEESSSLKNRLQQVESDARIKEEELMQQIRMVQNENEIARLEREKAMTTSKLHIQEHRDLLEAEQSTSSTLTAYESRIRELEDAIESLHQERDEEVLRIESFSSQMEEMKERTRTVIQERNEHYDQKLQLERKAESMATNAEQTQRELMDAIREKSSILSERDEARQRYVSIRDQLKDVMNQLDSVSSERNNLLQERTNLVSGSSAISEKEKTLAEESQRKTSQISFLQQKLTSVGAKIEKLTLQRGTFQRQRDEAGARLRAAGSEFAVLNSKLQSAIQSRDTLQKTVVNLRDEKDASLSQVQELSEIATQKKVAEESLASTLKQLQTVHQDLNNAREEINGLNTSLSELQKKGARITADMEGIEGKLEIAVHEKDLLKSQFDAVVAEKKCLQREVKDQQAAIADAETKQKALEAELSTVKEKSTLDVGIAKAELAGERKARLEQVDQLNQVQSLVKEHAMSEERMSSSIASFLRRGRQELEANHNVPGRTSFSSIIDAVIESNAQNGDVHKILSSTGDIFVNICAETCRFVDDLETLKATSAEAIRKAREAEAKEKDVFAVEAELHHARAISEEASKGFRALEEENVSLDMQCSDLREKLEQAESKSLALHAEVRDVTAKMQKEIEERAQLSEEEQNHLAREITKVTSNLHSVWDMLQKCLASHNIDTYTDDFNESEEISETEHVSTLILRAAARAVAELERNRTQLDETAARLVTGEAEISRLIDRAEIAENERDAYRGTNERLEKKAAVAFAEGEEKGKSELERTISHLEDELEDTKEELRRVSEKAVKSEKEAGELRALCSKLTAQFNGRTNELDEAEERVVYLEDQVTNLEEDLEESHRRLRVLEEESTQARKSDVDRLTAGLREATHQVESLEKDCARLREACDVAENRAKESEFLAETHKKAEENLQIAIEQLEAAQDSAVEQRTIELQKNVAEAEERCNKALEKEASVCITEDKLRIRDEEIKELRGAIGRLADERVELKLELEKSLSRLNHPDAGGQLVDRRVVRQLLVSYFRVGSIRRRDVLELMSRMLAFSDTDNVAVGLKRRALMDRIGSLVQPPELDNASLPPLGTVSDKWIEFLMNETEEGDEHAKGW